jgi:hypothetical protein
MFEQAPEWVSRSPRIRKIIIKIWRIFLRVQRATVAKAVLVARRQDDCVLAVATPSGELRLPCLELDGWKSVGTQVQKWADKVLQQPSKLKLQAIDGTPGRKGVTFLYSAEAPGTLPETGDTWLEAELAPSALAEGDRHLLLMTRRR